MALGSSALKERGSPLLKHEYPIAISKTPSGNIFGANRSTQTPVQNAWAENQALNTKQWLQKQWTMVNAQALGHTCEGLRDALFLPLPGLIVLLGRPLVILRQSALAWTQGVRIAAVLRGLVRGVVQGKLPDGAVLYGTIPSDLCGNRRTG